MNSLRAIPSHVITKIGGEESFVHSTWESAKMEDDRNAWAIPLSAYTYAGHYRRDTPQAGLDGATAFATCLPLKRQFANLKEAELCRTFLAHALRSFPLMILCTRRLPGSGVPAALAR
jgi:hypothetical protein